MLYVSGYNAQIIANGFAWTTTNQMNMANKLIADAYFPSFRIMKYSKYTPWVG